MTKVAGKSAGNCESKYCRALGPPVEIPTAMMRLGGTEGRACFREDLGGACGGLGMALGPPARLATLIFSASWRATGSRLPAAASVGLATKSIAPSARALKVE